MKTDKSKYSNHLRDEDMTAIITFFNYKMKQCEIAKQIDTSDSTVGYVIRAHRCVINKDWENARKMLQAKASAWKYLKFFSEQNNVTIPDDLEDFYQEGLNYKYNEKKKSKGTYDAELQIDERIVEEKSQEEKPIKSSDNNDVLYFVKLLELLSNTNELLEQFMDVVIPKYACDVKDNFNINFDLVCERLKGCEDKLEKVVYNTRKRGN